MSLSQTDSPWTDSPAKKKFQSQQSIKKVMLKVFMGIKGPITIDFLEQDATANISSFYELLRQY